MIELRLFEEKRWSIEKERSYYLPARLQYREVQNQLEIGLQEPIWSDWFDVPTVKGELYLD